jgi:hypothetical protein
MRLAKMLVQCRPHLSKLKKKVEGAFIGVQSLWLPDGEA